METLHKKMVVLMILIGLFLIETLPAKAETRDLGELCFNMSPNIAFEGNMGQLQVAVLSFSSGHFVLDGKIVPLISFSPNGHVNGSASLDGDNITGSLTVTPPAGSQSGLVSFLRIVLNTTTGFGTWEAAPLAPSPGGYGGPIWMVPCAD